jgi:hypothetical protein
VGLEMKFARVQVEKAPVMGLIHAVRP